MEKARFKWVLRERNRKIAAKTEAFTEQQARRVRSFHSSFKEYSPTPLIELTSLAQHLGIKNLFVKDESYLDSMLLKFWAAVLLLVVISLMN